MLKNLKTLGILIGAILALSINIFAYDETTAKDVDVNRIKSKMRQVNYLDRVLKPNKLMYIKGESEPFTGTLFLMVGDYLEYTEVYEHGVLQGDKTWYDPQGNIMMIESYVNGKIRGEQVTYYPNTKIRSVITYYDNSIRKIEWFDKEGRSIFREEYRNGTGRWKSYYDNGVTVHEEGYYVNGSRDGEWKFYNEKGNLVKKINYRMGTQIGISWY